MKRLNQLFLFSLRNVHIVKLKLLHTQSRVINTKWCYISFASEYDASYCELVINVAYSNISKHP